MAFAKPEYCTHYGTIFYESKVIAGKSSSETPKGVSELQIKLFFRLPAQIGVADALVGQQLGTGAVHDHAAGLQHIGAVGHRKGHLCILLD